MRKYRIKEEKYDNVSYFYPQYKDKDDSEYKYFFNREPGLNEPLRLKRDVFYELPLARKRIEYDIKNQTTKKLKETIIHEY